MGYKSPWPWPWPPSPLMTIFIFILFTFTTTTTSYSSNPPLSPSPPPRSPPPPPPPNPNPTLKPSMTIVVGVLTTVFSITFLLLLYAKHCRRPEDSGGDAVAIRGGYTADRENSGIDRTIIESLPVFRFGSLSGQKDGLECAVCLTRFDPSEVLRLLPKCKHAFHIECVDTWLDAHSTCPLCRYRVDPEDIFLVFGEHAENEITRDIVTLQEVVVKQQPPEDPDDGVEVALRRVSGRHSSVEPSSSAPAPAPALSRRSLDSWKSLKKAGRKSKKKEETAPLKAVPVTAEDHRKDGMLLAELPPAAAEEERRRRSSGKRRRSFEKRFEHRIVVGAQRWSDVQPSDLLYLRSEMILCEVRRSRRSRPSVLHEENNGSGRDVINSRSVSEMTGVSRFGSNEMLSRWQAWRSEPKSKPPVLQSEPNSCSTNV